MKIAFFTLGCKVNQYETRMLAELFSKAGYEVASHEDPNADVYVVNSCTVTAEGDRKTRQMVRRFKKQNLAACVALTGCFPQAFPDAAQQLPEADVIAGTRCRALLPDLVEEFLRTGKRVVRVVSHEKGEPIETGSAQSGGHTRAFLKIEDGCERYCAYCIIPKARGPVRSMPLEQVREEMDRLARRGYQEVVLTGINLSCYGKDLGLRLADAVEAAGQTGVARVRLGSLEPELLEKVDIARLARQPKLCPQFHMSLQSGCAATLKRMRRHYTPKEYGGIVSLLREQFPGCAITTDIMVGFPGETEEEFLESMARAKSFGFAKAHVFPYSPRPGTKAADMPGQVSNAVKAARSARMQDAMEESRRTYLEAQVGRVLQVLFETKTPEGWEGYGENYMPVRVRGGEALQGQICPVKITGLFDNGCIGQIDE